MARSKVVFFFWLYVHGTDITLPPGEVFTRDWDGSLDPGEAATERIVKCRLLKGVFFPWLYVHGTDITLPPGGVFTRDWDGSLDSG